VRHLRHVQAHLVRRAEEDGWVRLVIASAQCSTPGSGNERPRVLYISPAVRPPPPLVSELSLLQPFEFPAHHVSSEQTSSAKIWVLAAGAKYVQPGVRRRGLLRVTRRLSVREQHRQATACAHFL
jgi:hypothetical protein